MSDRAYVKVQVQQKTLIGSPPKSSLLQRTCACGQHTIAGGECSTCRSEQSALLRSQRSFGASSTSIPIQEYASSVNPVFSGTSHFGYDFSQIPIYPTQRAVPQSKLKVNQPGDVYEADQVAEHVVQMPNITEIPLPLQRQCTCTGLSESTEECAECKAKREDTLQRSVTNQVTPAAATTVLPVVHNVLNSRGQSLDTGTRTLMESRFGHDFSQVRVHTDARAAESARLVNALAYTVGRDVVFGEGQYQPSSNKGQLLLAHELTHVVQQGKSVPLGVIVARAVDDESKLKAETKSPQGQSGATERLYALIVKIEQEYQRLTKLLPGDEGRQQIKIVAQRLERLRAIAAGHDEALKVRVLEIFSPQRLQQVKMLVPLATQGSTTTVMGQQHSEKLAAMPLRVSRPQDSSEVEANQIAAAVVSGKRVSVERMPLGDVISRQDTTLDQTANFTDIPPWVWVALVTAGPLVLLMSVGFESDRSQSEIKRYCYNKVTECMENTKRRPGELSGWAACQECGNACIKAQGEWPPSVKIGGRTVRCE